VDLNTLRPLESLQGHIMIAVAVRFGATRLIDNLQMMLDKG
jgi:pantothenate synthetase